MASFWDFLPALVTAGVGLYGAKLQSDASNQATKTAANATTQATQMEVDAQQRAMDQELALLREAQAQQGAMQRQASPGLVAMQGIIGRGSALTPAQEIALADARRTSLDALQGGSLRGSGRATAAVVNDVEGRMRGQFMDENQRRADEAASNLSGQYFNSGNQVTNLFKDMGTSASTGLTGIGTSRSQGTSALGAYGALDTLNQGAIQGKAIGDIGAVINDYIKTSDQANKDRYYGTSYVPNGPEVNWNAARM